MEDLKQNAIEQYGVMAVQTSYDKGFEAGKRLYVDHPTYDLLAILSWAGTEAAREQIHIQRLGDYQSGVQDGYAKAKGELNATYSRNHNHQSGVRAV